MIEMIEELISKEYAYESEKHMCILKLKILRIMESSQTKLEDLIAGSRLDFRRLI